MGVKKYNPTSPGRRFQTVSDFGEVTSDKPYEPLLRALKKTGGRNSYGRVTVWQRGGGNKRLYRVIDFKRDKHSIPAVVETIEYDPNRSARIALLKYRDGERRYIVSPQGLKVGDDLISGRGVEIKTGNALPLNEIPRFSGTVGQSLYPTVIPVSASIKNHFLQPLSQGSTRDELSHLLGHAHIAFVTFLGTQLLVEGRSGYNGISLCVVYDLRIYVIQASIHRKPRPLRCPNDLFPEPLVTPVSAFFCLSTQATNLPSPIFCQPSQP